MPAYEEPINKRYKVRFYFNKGSQSPLGYGYSIKLTLIDEQNLLLYQNILELTYSSVNRAVKAKSVRAPSIIRGKGAVSKPSWNEKTLQLMSRNFVDDGCKIIGEEYRLPIKKAMKKSNLKLDELLHPQ